MGGAALESYLSGAVRALGAFLAVLLLACFLRKESLSRLSFFDLMAGVAIGSIAASMATDTPNRTWYYLMVLGVFGLAVYLAGQMAAGNKPLRKLVEEEPMVVIHNGRVLEHNIKKLRYNLDYVLSQLRERNVFNLEDVEFALLERDGGLSVLLKSQKRPGAVFELNQPRSGGNSSQIIVDGQVVYANLRQNQLDEQWLIAELNKRGHNSPRDIAYAGLTADGKLIIYDKSEKTSI